MSDNERELPPTDEAVGVTEESTELETLDTAPAETTAEQGEGSVAGPEKDLKNGDDGSSIEAKMETEISEEPAAPEGETSEPTAKPAPGEEGSESVETAPEEPQASDTETAAAAEPSAPPPRGSVQVRRRRKQTYASDVKAGQTIEGVFMALRKSLPMDRNGRRFLAVTLADRTGRIEARLWDNAESISESFQESDHLRVRGETQSHHGRLQLRLESLERVDISSLDLPASEFISESSKPLDRMLDELRSVLDKIKNPHLKALVNAFLDDPDLGPRFRRAPAAQSIHHAWIGGLLEHTLSVVRLCERLCDHYPQVDRDLVLAGAFLHDFGKTEELSYDETLGYTDAGRLVGHLVICCQWIHERAGAVPGLPRSMVDQLVHIVASHHGQIEYGSVRRPQTLEALLVHSADVLDARMSSWVELLETAGPDGWTDFSRVYDRQLFRGGADVSAAGSPIRKKRKKRRRRKGEGEPTAGEPGESRPAPARRPAPAAEGQEGARRARPETRTGESRRGGRRPDRPEGERRPGSRPEQREGGRTGRPPAGPRTEGAAAPSREKKPTLTFNPFAKLKERVEEPAGEESGKPAPQTSAESVAAEKPAGQPPAEGSAAREGSLAPGEE